MFCPQCRAEYRDGFDVCADCDVKLVEALPTEPQPDYVEFKHILDTYNPADIAILKSILQSENVIYYFQGDHLTLRPYGAPARLMVEKNQAAFVQRLIKDIKLSYIESSV